MKFYVGLHHPHDAKHFDRCMVSVKALADRVSDFPADEWMLDSGAFTEIKDHGEHRLSAEEYAVKVNRWATCGRLVAAVSQDWMCEKLILDKTGLTVADHQYLTIRRYDELRELVVGTYLMPVLQGYWPHEYVEHIRAYGSRLAPCSWVGVGSVCKRNGKVDQIEAVFMAIRRERPDLFLHGFGVKLTALASSVVRSCLATADSMAWSYGARKQGGDSNDWREARRFVEQIEGQRVRRRRYQSRLF